MNFFGYVGSSILVQAQQSQDMRTELRDFKSSKKMAVLLGGSGDEPGKFIFEDSLRNISGNLQDGNYRTLINYNGNKSEVKQALEGSELQAKNRAFTLENAHQSLKIVDQMLSTCDPKVGGQLLIYLDGHGTMSEKTDSPYHSIITEDGGVVGEFHNSLLKGLPAKAKKCNIKLAVVDMSCYSGATINLFKNNPEVCVVSMATPDHVGYSDFGKNFSAHLKPGTSLETAFLNARSTTYSPGYPQISTESGKGIYRALKEMGLHLSTKKVDRCDPKDLDQLSAKANSILDLLGKNFEISSQELTTYRQDIADYIALRKKLLSLTEYGESRFKLGKWEYTYQELMQLDSISAAAEKFPDQKSFSFLVKFKKFIEDQQALRTKREDALENDAQFKEYVNQMTLSKTSPSLPVLEEQLYFLAQKIVKIENMFYTRIYENIDSKKPNACKNFIF